MKKGLIVLLLLAGFASVSKAQELLLDSVARAKFTGIYQGGEIEQFFYIPYFSTSKTDKKNFIVRQLNSQTYSEEHVLRYELPASYALKSSTFNGSSYLFHFYDESKKEEVLISATGENINKKKTIKASDDVYFLFAGSTPEDFIIVTTGNKGDYKVQKLDASLENKWEKKFSAPSGANRQIVSMKNSMGILEIVRKDMKQGNKFEFSVHKIQMEDGSDMSQNTLVHDNIMLYPTFFSEKEGMNFSGGYYFANGVISGKPNGIFFAQMTPDGQIEQMAKVPYSQVIEDLKNTGGDKLSAENTTILFVGGYMAHESQKLIMGGQIMSRENNENNTKVSFSDFVTIKFSMEHEYKGAVSTPYEGNEVVLTNLPAAVNTLDLGTWMQSSSLTPFSRYLNMPGTPPIVYKTLDENGQTNLCFRTIGIKNDTTRPECMILYREPQKAGSYAFTGNFMKKPIHYRSDLSSNNDIGSIVSYELNNNTLLLMKRPLPRLDKVMRPAMPEDMEGHDGGDPEARPIHEQEQSEQ